MRKFDLDAAKRGQPIQTRDGRPAKFIAHVPEAFKSHRLVVIINCAVQLRYENGSLFDTEDNDNDLFMAPRKRTVWVNLYKDGIARWHYTESTADSFSDVRIGNRAWALEIEE